MPTTLDLNVTATIADHTKRFNEQQNVGKSKYLVNYHDGVQTHSDGSPFFGIAIFSNKRTKDQFARGLRQQGYKAE